MSRHLTATVAGYALLGSAWTGWRAAMGRGLEPAQAAIAVFLELVLVAQAAIEAERLVRGGASSEPATHVGYLVASVAVLPIALTNLSRERSRWDAAIVAVGMLAAAIVTLRLEATGG